MSILQYGQRWGAAFGKFGKNYTEAQAKKSYDLMKQFGVLIEINEKNNAVIQFGINRDLISVYFLDNLKRYWLSYTFMKFSGDENLFLSDCHFFEFRGTGIYDRISGEHLEFKKDGTLKVTVINFETNERKTGSKKGVDVADHWEPYPEFGKYDSLLRMERGALSTLRS